LYLSLKPHTKNTESPNARPSYVSLSHQVFKVPKQGAVGREEKTRRNVRFKRQSDNPYVCSKFNLDSTIH